MTGGPPTLVPDSARMFEPPQLLRNPHCQSILASLGPRNRRVRRAAAAMLAVAVPEVIELDGVRLLGHWSRQAARPASRAAGGAPGERPPPRLLVILHGWEGSADSHYVVALAGKAYGQGYDVFRLNFRDHGGTAALNEGLFHSCRLEEVAAAVGHVASRHGASATFLAGFSLGGNFALRVAAHPAAAGLLGKVVAVCPVVKPSSTMRALERGLWVYRDYFLRRWRRSLAAKAAAFPARYDFGDLRRFRTLTETTAFFVERYTDFGGLDAYLDGYALTGDVLAGLAVPSSILAARDDPVIPSRDLEAIARGGALDITLARHGGHCGFLEDFRLRSWLEGRILALLE